MEGRTFVVIKGTDEKNILHSVFLTEEQLNFLEWLYDNDVFPNIEYEVCREDDICIEAP
jgi:hypothetical protein